MNVAGNNFRCLSLQRFFGLHTIILLIVGLFCSCQSSKKIAAPDQLSNELVSWVFKYDRSPCFGQCAVYTFYLLTDHRALIDVKSNLLEPGWYLATLDQENIHQMLAEMESSLWWYEDISDQPEIPDLPVMSLLYKHEDGIRGLAIQGKISDPVSRFIQTLSHLIQEGRWVETTLRPLNPVVPDYTHAIVQLKKGVQLSEWMRKFESFGIQLVRRVAPRLHYYVVSKDPATGTAHDFLQAIRLDPDVIEAQWDQEVHPRN
jgi:hypothetical protein